MQQLGGCNIQGCTLSLQLKLKTHFREYSEFDTSKTELRIGSKIPWSSLGELQTTRSEPLTLL